MSNGGVTRRLQSQPVTKKELRYVNRDQSDDDLLFSMEDLELAREDDSGSDLSQADADAAWQAQQLDSDAPTDSAPRVDESECLFHMDGVPEPEPENSAAGLDDDDEPEPELKTQNKAAEVELELPSDSLGRERAYSEPPLRGASSAPRVIEISASHLQRLTSAQRALATAGEVVLDDDDVLSAEPMGVRFTKLTAAGRDPAKGYSQSLSKLGTRPVPKPKGGGGYW